MANAALTTLLEVQRLDTKIDQLVHQRAELPVRAEIAKVETEHRAIREELEVARGRAHELERVQRRLEDEIATVGDKASGTDRQLYSGAVTAPAELQALQEQLTSLRRRISGLEDEVIEVMEQLEPVAAEVDRLTSIHDASAAGLEALRAQLGTEEAAIDGDLRRLREERAGLAASVSADLVARYEKIRARAGGVGIAVLDGHRCTGCHLTVPNREVDELHRAPVDAVLLHDECGRILVLQD